MARSRPSVSLVVLNWNGRRHLATCLDSLMALDYPRDRLQVILCDNGSADGSVEFVRKRYPAVEVLALPTNHGFARANNLAVEQATGEWVGFLNNDMRVEAGWLQHLFDELDRHPDAACLASRILNWDGTAIDFIGGGANYQGHGFQLDSGEPSSPEDVERRLLFACGGAMVIRRDVFEEVGGFDPEFFAYFEDVDLGWRLNVLGYDTWYSPRATVYHVHHGTSSRLEYHRLRVLYERNALMSIYKTLEDATLARVLPAALLLVNERALTINPVDRDQFALPGDTTGSARYPVPAPASAPEAGRERVLRRAHRVLTEEGGTAAAVKAVKLLRWHLYGRPTEKIRERLLEQFVPIHRVAVSHWLALAQFGNELDRLNEKRAWIQQRRRRSDAEVAPLLVDPFYANHNDRAYLAFYEFVTRQLGVEELFGRPPD